MKFVLRIFMLAVFAMVGLFPNVGTMAPENTIKIEVSHSHEHGDDHHHHGVSSEDYHHEHEQASTTDEHHDSSRDPASSHQHSHEIVVGGGQVFTAVPKVELVGAQDFERIFPNPFEELPPRSQYLGSIFRPPIQA